MMRTRWTMALLVAQGIVTVGAGALVAAVVIETTTETAVSDPFFGYLIAAFLLLVVLVGAVLWGLTATGRRRGDRRRLTVSAWLTLGGTAGALWLVALASEAVELTTSAWSVLATAALALAVPAAGTLCTAAPGRTGGHES